MCIIRVMSIWQYLLPTFIEFFTFKIEILTLSITVVRIYEIRCMKGAWFNA